MYRAGLSDEVIDAVWLPEQDDTVGAAETAWARTLLDALQSYRAGVYVNFLDSDEVDEWRPEPAERTDGTLTVPRRIRRTSWPPRWPAG